MSTGLLGMQLLFENPIEGAGAYEAYTKYRMVVTDGYAGIIRTMGDRNITFTEKEPGYPFYMRIVPAAQ
jgi:hypothetical protein